MDSRSFDREIARIAGEFRYPPAPDLRRIILDRLNRPTSGSRIRLMRGATVVGVLLAIALLVAAVPSARATLVELLELGAVRIRLVPSRPTLSPPDDVAPRWPPDFAGETTLSEASDRFPYPLRLPAPSTGLGPPDRVYAQDNPAESVILVWLDQDHPGPKLALFELAPSVIYQKSAPTTIERTQVGGLPALWTSGPYLVEVQGGDLARRRLIDGHVLIWTEGEVTYRLETAGTLQAAVVIADALR
jgi:hypothetical protein